jgi:hypothetical protein
MINNGGLDLSALPAGLSALPSEAELNQNNELDPEHMDISLNDTLNSTHICVTDVDDGNLNDIIAQNVLDKSHIYEKVDDTPLDDECHIYVSDIAENVLLDLINWLQELVKECQLLQRPKKIMGIIDMSDSAVELVIESIGTTLRSSYMAGLNNPEKFIDPKQIPTASILTQNTINMPDACVLKKRVVDCVFSEPAADWFQDFENNCDHWNVVFKEKEENTSSSSHNKGSKGGGKRIKEEGKKSEDTEALEVEPQQATLEHRIRFLRAVRDLEMSGIVKMKSQGTVISRQAYTWLDE